jgi:hypothetical protein
METLIGRTFAYQVQFGSSYTFTGTNATAWCATPGCITATDPRVVGDAAHHRAPFESWSVDLPNSNFQSLASYLPASQAGPGTPLNFPSNYAFEKFDSAIDITAKKLSSFQGPVLFRPFHEFSNCLQPGVLTNPSPCTGNGDDFAGTPFAFPQYWPPSCSVPWPPTSFATQCSVITAAEQQLLFQNWWEGIAYRMTVIDHATNVYFIWNPTSAAFSVTGGYLPTTCYVPTCTSYNPTATTPLYWVDGLGVDAYDDGGTSSYSGTVSAWYNSFCAAGAGYSLPCFLTETGNPSSDLTNAASFYPSQSGCPNPATYTPGTTSQYAYFTSMLSQYATYSWKGVSPFQSWSAYPKCARDWNFGPLDPYGAYAYYTLGGNSQFSAMTVGTPAPTYTAWPTPTPSPTST